MANNLPVVVVLKKNMRHRLPQARLAMLLLFCVGTSSLCRAESLSNLLQMALSGEPTLQGARANVEASDARSRQALGAFLPQVTLSANTNINHRDYQTRNIVTPDERDRYNSHLGQLNVTQPIWRYANIASMQQADAAKAQAQHQLTGTEQELFSKLVNAWFDVLAARDNITFTKQQVLATHRQLEITQRGVDFGTAGIPQMRDAGAKYEQAVSDSISAETDSQVKIATLEQLVGGLAPFTPPYLRDDADLVNLQADRLERWVDAVEISNPNLIAARFAFEAAGAEVSKQKAGHHPTLDLVGTYSNNSQTVGGFPGQNGYDIKQGTIGLQLNVPLYSGGTQSAKVMEAVATREKARFDIEAARRAAVFAAKQGWAGWRAGYARAEAGRQAVIAAKSSIEVARAGMANGLKTELDVLQAEQQLYAGLRDLRKGTYDQITSHIKLKATAGSLIQTDVESIDRLFVSDIAAESSIKLPTSASDFVSDRLTLKRPVSLPQ